VTATLALLASIALIISPHLFAARKPLAGAIALSTGFWLGVFAVVLS